jgi:2,3-bisphosphoglycerate-dependent phosphoglycerate mutase
LSDLGRDEARAAGLYLSQCGLEQLYTSPLDRTQETASAIAEQTGLTAKIEDAVAEHRGDETFERVKTRIRDFVARIECEPAQVVGVVTHGSPIKAVLQLLSSEAIDLSKYSFDNGNHVPTGGIWLAERTGRSDGGWTLELVFTPALVRTY